MLNTFIIYKNDNIEDVVVRLYCSLNEANAINYNLENYCVYGHRYTVRQVS